MTILHSFTPAKLAAATGTIKSPRDGEEAVGVRSIVAIFREVSGAISTYDKVEGKRVERVSVAARQRVTDFSPCKISTLIFENDDLIAASGTRSGREIEDGSVPNFNERFTALSDCDATNPGGIVIDVNYISIGGTPPGLKRPQSLADQKHSIVIGAIESPHSRRLRADGVEGLRVLGPRRLNSHFFANQEADFASRSTPNIRTRGRNAPSGGQESSTASRSRRHRDRSSAAYFGPRTVLSCTHKFA